MRIPKPCRSLRSCSKSQHSTMSLVPIGRHQLGGTPRRIYCAPTFFDAIHDKIRCDKRHSHGSTVMRWSRPISHMRYIHLLICLHQRHRHPVSLSDLSLRCCSSLSFQKSTLVSSFPDTSLCLYGKMESPRERVR